MNCPRCGFQLIERKLVSRDPFARRCQNRNCPTIIACPECGRTKGHRNVTLGGTRVECLAGHRWDVEKPGPRGQED